MPSSIQVAIAALNTQWTILGHPGFYAHNAFPLVNLAVKRLKKVNQAHKVTNEEAKPGEFTDEEIDVAFCALPDTSNGVQCKLYILLLCYLNHHSTKVIYKKVSDFIIEKDGKWVEVWCGTNKKSSTMKSKPNLNVHMWLVATPSALYCCPVMIIHQQLANLLAPCNPNNCIFCNYNCRDGRLSAQPMGKGNVKPWLFELVLSTIPHLTYLCNKYLLNSLCWATAIAAITEAKDAVIQQVMYHMHHTSTSGLNTYLTDSACDLSMVENAILTCECT